MKFRHLALVFCLLPLIGCFDVTNGVPAPLGAIAQNLSTDLSDRVFPGIPSGRVKVRYINQSESPADARVTMRVFGKLVRLINRRVDGNSDSIILGPDFADTVLTEADILSDPPRSMPMETFTLGTTFQPGQTIVITIPPDPIDNTNDNVNENTNTNTNTNDNVAPPPVEISIVNLDDEIRVNAGTAVMFNIAVENAAPGAIVRAFADADSNPDNANEISITDVQAATENLVARWDTTDVAPGLYSIYAEVADGDAFLRTGPAAGKIRINSPPSLVLSNPRAGLVVTRDLSFVVAWAGQDVDDNAQIKIFLDTDNDFENGIERLLKDGISEDDIADRDLAVNTADLASTEYFVGGTIDDGLSTQVVYAGRVCISPRLVGRYTPAEVPPVRIVKLASEDADGRFGADIDVTHDLNADGFGDLIVSEPFGTAPDLGQTGIIYYHEGAGTWPQSLSTSEFNLTIFGPSPQSAAGARVAMLPALSGDGTFDMMIGAPQFVPEKSADGRAYIITGTSARTATTLNLNNVIAVNDPPTPTAPDTYVPGHIITGGFSDQAGLDIASAGDLDGDGIDDYAIGAATGGELQEGRVALVAGPGKVGRISIDAIGVGRPGKIALGGTFLGNAGYAIQAAGDFNGDTFDDILISAPAASQDSAVPTGVVYMVNGHESLFSGYENAFRLTDIAFNFIPGHIFVGQNANDLAGNALAALDFNGDSKIDIVIGAPGFGNSRGRVYVIYNQVLPTIVQLSDVGGAIAGVVFDGLAEGDQLGASISSAGDFDGDSKADLLMGAPGAESRTGTAYLIYGGQALPSNVPLTSLSTCELNGLQLVGEAPQNRLGAAVSGGADLNGDSVSDVGIGAPGDPLADPSPAGKAYLLFGRGD